MMANLCIEVLLVDDDEDYFFITRDLLKDIEGIVYKVEWTPNLMQAHEALNKQYYDVCLVDYHIGAENGLDFLRKAIQERPNLPFILLTGQGDRRIDLEAMNIGASDYVNKGELSAVLLERAIRYAIDRAQNLGQLRDYAEDLEVKNRELDAYSHTIAHDLTNPLSLITGLVGLVLLKEGTQLSSEAVEMLKSVEDQAVRMSEMVTQLLWMAQLRDASEVLSLLEIEPIVKSAIFRFTDRIEKHGVKVEIESPLPMALGQSIWVEEVFANLVGNAIKYIGSDNPAPKITIRGFKQDNLAIYEVVDNGIGIAPEDQSRLFEMFSRVRNKRTRDVQGMGLGLSIVHRIVGKLGGEVGVRSVLNEGSIFWFSLSTTPNF
jgi:two-component system sensor histidine kinase/response regulator